MNVKNIGWMGEKLEFEISSSIEDIYKSNPLSQLIEVVICGQELKVFQFQTGYRIFTYEAVFHNPEMPAYSTQRLIEYWLEGKWVAKKNH